MSERTDKLIALRSRTDHDLSILVQRELDRGFTLAEAARTRNSPQFAPAVKSCETATALLSRITALNPDDRMRMESRAKELQSKLAQVPLYSNARPASMAS